MCIFKSFYYFKYLKCFPNFELLKCPFEKRPVRTSCNIV